VLNRETQAFADRYFSRYPSLIDQTNEATKLGDAQMESGRTSPQICRITADTAFGWHGLACPNSLDEFVLIRFDDGRSVLSRLGVSSLGSKKFDHDHIAMRVHKKQLEYTSTIEEHNLYTVLSVIKYFSHSKRCDKDMDGILYIARKVWEARDESPDLYEKWYKEFKGLAE